MIVQDQELCLPGGDLPETLGTLHFHWVEPKGWERSLGPGLLVLAVALPLGEDLVLIDCLENWLFLSLRFSGGGGDGAGNGHGRHYFCV